MKRVSENRERIVDILKGLCILMVCFSHYEWSAEECSKMLFPWWNDLAVPVFMVLSGYVYEKSRIRRGAFSLSQAYNTRDLLSKAIRFTLPFVPVFIATLLWDNHHQGQLYYDPVIIFLQGGIGKGSYYYPVMMQTMFVLPLIAAIVRRHEEKGLLLCLGINLVYEVLHVAYMMPVSCYRLLMPRYIFVLAAGCYIALGKKIPRLLSILLFLGGIGFICLAQYSQYELRYLIDWTTTCCLASMFIVPMVWVILRKCNFRFAPMELLGKASYNIFLVQMLYFYTLAPLVYQRYENRNVQLLISMAACVVVGVLYYWIETPATKYIQRLVKKLPQT